MTISPGRLRELIAGHEEDMSSNFPGGYCFDTIAALRELEQARTTLEGVRAYFAALDAPIDQGSFNAVLQKHLDVMEAESKLRAMLSAAPEKEPAQEKQR